MRVVLTYQDGDPAEHVERDEALPGRRRRRRRRGRGHAALGVAVARRGGAGLQIRGDGRRVVAADELVAPHRPRSRPPAAARLRQRPFIGRSSSAHEHKPGAAGNTYRIQQLQQVRDKMRRGRCGAPPHLTTCANHSPVDSWSWWRGSARLVPLPSVLCFHPSPLFCTS
jgi:hypothetical protein